MRIYRKAPHSKYAGRMSQGEHLNRNRLQESDAFQSIIKLAF